MTKQKLISGKVNEDTKEEFERLCKENNSNASREIRGFALQYIKKHKSTRISLSELTKKH